MISANWEVGLGGLDRVTPPAQEKKKHSKTNTKKKTCLHCYISLCKNPLAPIADRANTLINKSSAWAAGEAVCLLHPSADVLFVRSAWHTEEGLAGLWGGGGGAEGVAGGWAAAETT